MRALKPYPAKYLKVKKLGPTQAPKYKTETYTFQGNVI